MTWSADVTLIVEFGFGSGPLAATPTFTDVVTAVRGLTITRGRSSVRSSFDAGSCTIILDNTDGEFDPNNSQSTYAGNMEVGTPVRIRATYGVTTYPLFYGSVTRWPLTYPHSGKDGVAVVDCGENLAVLNTTRLSASYSQEGSDDRIDNVLDDADWPAAARDLDAQSTPVAAVDYEGDALTAILAAVDAEQGEFFIAKNGDATFLNRVAFSTASSQATFNPGTNLDYRDVQLAYDNDFLINHALITAANDQMGEASDVTSISDHGESFYEATIDTVISGAYATNVADWIVGKNKDVTVRVTGLSISPQVDPSTLWPEVLDRELQDLITVTVDPPGAGDTLTQVVGVEGIQHDITPGVWMVSYTCHPLSAFEVADYWILGTSDDLDTDTVLA
jgi:hypothetical protein